MTASRTTVALLAVSLLGGCATEPSDRKPPASAADFAGWPCDTLGDELVRVQQRATDVAYAVDVNANGNPIVFTPGTTVFWPALMAMRPEGPDGAELARLRGRFEALEAAARPRCAPPGDPLQRTAAMPLAQGERLVYEERAGSGGPAQEFGLRLQGLKRGELDFLLERGEGRPGSPWRQDAAGNAIAPRAAHRLLAWTRLLHRDLALGDVLSGELHGPQLVDGTAHVRGQVIAVGPSAVSGRQFHSATIELFGDAPSGGSITRIDGVMVVDRFSGVLLRLELRSGNPEYALRRKLVRVEPAT